MATWPDSTRRAAIVAALALSGLTAAPAVAAGGKPVYRKVVRAEDVR